MRRPVAVTVLVIALCAVPTTALADPPVQHASCAAFGANVAMLGQLLGADFGATASSVATSGPGNFPALVVRPEQAALCEPRP
jgi:hypothetical protein